MYVEQYSTTVFEVGMTIVRKPISEGLLCIY